MAGQGESDDDVERDEDQAVRVVRVETANVSSLVEVAERLASEAGGGNLWFRGHASSEWSLKPAMFRERSIADVQYSPDSRWDILWHGFQHFGRRLLDPSPEPDRLQWLFIMQHVGLPTPLLDWSQNFLAALFFAVEWETQLDMREEAERSAVWVLDTMKFAVREAVLRARGSAAPSLEEMLDWWWAPRVERLLQRQHQQRREPEDHVTMQYPRPWLPRHAFQSGVATLHTSGTPMEELSLLRPGTLVRVEFPRSACPALQRQLASLGVTRSSLFGGLEALASRLLADHALHIHEMRTDQPTQP